MEQKFQGGGDICFYPHEEIIRFINRYVQKRDSWTHFHNIMPISESAWKEFAELVGPIVDFDLISYSGMDGAMKHQRAHMIVRKPGP